MIRCIRDPSKEYTLKALWQKVLKELSFLFLCSPPFSSQNLRAIALLFQPFSLVDAGYGDDESVDENRGVVATRLLVEMNYEVCEDAVEDSSEDILHNKPSKSGQQTLTICDQAASDFHIP